jgi:hypothetical protein
MEGWEGFIFGAQSIHHTIFGQSTNVHRASQIMIMVCSN